MYRRGGEWRENRLARVLLQLNTTGLPACPVDPSGLGGSAKTGVAIGTALLPLAGIFLVPARAPDAQQVADTDGNLMHKAFAVMRRDFNHEELNLRMDMGSGSMKIMAGHGRNMLAAKAGYWLPANRPSRREKMNTKSP